MTLALACCTSLPVGGGADVIAMFTQLMPGSATVNINMRDVIRILRNRRAAPRPWFLLSTATLISRPPLSVFSSCDYVGEAGTAEERFREAVSALVNGIIE